MLRKILFSLSLLAGMTFLMSTSCEEAHQDDPGGSPCGGYVTATATGAVNQELCFDIYGNYAYQENSTLNLLCAQDKDIAYDLSINMDAARGPFNGTGTYECGVDKSGFIVLDLHDLEGNLIESYKSISGTINITKAEEFHFEATFDVTLTDSDNEVMNIEMEGVVVK